MFLYKELNLEQMTYTFTPEEQIHTFTLKEPSRLLDV